MSTEDTGDRTQKPTERRRREARARGQVARSADLVTGLVLLAAAATLWWFGPTLGNELAGLMRAGLSSAPTSLDGQTVAANIWQIASRLAIVVLPILLAIAGAATAANLVQTGFLWVPTAVLPKLERLDPGRALSQWAATHSWIGLSWSIVKLALLLAVLWIYGRMRLASAGPLAEASPLAMYSLAGRLIAELALVLSVALVMLALFDYVYQFWRTEHQLMMTVEEVRREQREDEGNPQVKRRQRNMATSRTTREVDGPQPL